jgi:serine/threonine-protein kinase HipA
MTLSPAYDIQPQAHQPNDGEVALAVGGEYRHAALAKDHLIAEGHAWGLASAPDLAEETLTTVLQVAATQSPHKHAHTDLAQDIAGFAANLLAGRAIGASEYPG